MLSAFPLKCFDSQQKNINIFNIFSSPCCLQDTSTTWEELQNALWNEFYAPVCSYWILHNVEHTFCRSFILQTFKFDFI